METFNLRKLDNFIKNRKRLSNSKIEGINSNQVTGYAAKSTVMDSINNMTNDSLNKLKDDPIDALFGIKTKKDDNK